MRRAIKIIILGALVVSALGSAAAAPSWGSSYAFTATAPATKVTIGSSPAVNVICTGSNGATGTIYRVPPPGKFADLAFTFGTCRTAGFASTVSCPANGVAVVGISRSPPTIVGEADQGASVATICTFAVPALAGCTIRLTATGGAGARAMSVNYNDTLTTPAFTFFVAGQTLTATWSSCPGIFPASSGSATATFGTNATPSADIVYRITAPNPTPWIVG